MLGRMRKLDKKIIQIIEDMPITYDIEQDALYLKGREKGVEQIVIRCLNQGITFESIVPITGLTIEQIAEIDKKKLGCSKNK